jgi:hypothetical protein
VVNPNLAAVGNSAPGGKEFAGNPYVQVLYSLCPKCSVIRVFQQCD